MPRFEYQPDLMPFELVHQGKVRDVYAFNETQLIMVATDRLSAFDVILPDPIPDKGRILTQISNFWFKKSQSIIENHLIEPDASHCVDDPKLAGFLKGRSVLCKRLKPLPVEAIVRGYIIGSGWKAYQANSSLCGIPLPDTLSLADAFDQPLFTPSTKADVGGHDENISFSEMCNMIGEDLAIQVKEASLKLYNMAREFADSRGIIIADTKFEFGLDSDSNLVLMDEILTPDSSRFWPKDKWQAGVNPPSFDKQFVRDYLETLDWDKQSPGPRLPKAIITQTAGLYQLAQEILLG